MRYELVVMGTSLGGLTALDTLFRALPGDFPLPIIVVQHRGAPTSDHLRAVLQRHSVLRVREPVDKESIATGSIYLAPADYHLLVEKGFLSLSTEGAVSYSRPSIDVLFESAADAYKGATIAVALTGANRDGVQGAAAIKKAGGLVLVQDPQTAESPALPRGVLETVPVDHILPLSQIAPCLVQLGFSTHA